EGFPYDRNACRYDGQTSARRYAKPVHRFTDDEFTQHGSERCTAGAASGISGFAGSFQLNVKSLSVRRDLLPEQHGTAVTKHGKIAELVAGICLGNGFGIFRDIRA